MEGHSYFSKIDLSKGYFQCELDEESKQLTVFATPKGLYRLKRLVMGFTCASEIFQCEIGEVLKGIPSVGHIQDDILIFAKNLTEHNAILEQVLRRLEAAGLTINRSKSAFGVREVHFMGMLIAESGIAPAEKKVHDICKFATPANVGELRSFLGMVVFMSKFLPSLATIATPLFRRTKKGIEWSWGDCEQQAFEEVKAKLSERQHLVRFQPERETALFVDASPVGVGAILSQKVGEHFAPVSFASKTLTPVQQRFSQTEREALAIKFGVEKFHSYLYGAPRFQVFTDHKPLVSMFAPNSKPPLRIEKWIVHLQPYDFQVTYRAGVDNPADYLSRYGLVASEGVSDGSENFINAVTVATVPKSCTLNELRAASADDQEMQIALKSLRSGRWTSGGFLLHVRHYLTEAKGLLYYNRCLVVPQKLRTKLVEIAHEGHQGSTKTKMRLRSKVWWPGLNRDVDDHIKRCLACQACVDSTHAPPVQATEMPKNAWSKVGVDLMGPFPSGESLFVIIDYHTRYPDVYIMKSTTTSDVIKRLDESFTRYGIPDEVVSDNGPQFVSAEFSGFCSRMGIKHRKVTPLWPRANGEVERFNRVLNKYVKSRVVENLSWQTGLNAFLYAYRVTPHCSTGASPMELMLNRRVRDKIPGFSKRVAKSQVRQNDQRSKQKYANGDMEGVKIGVGDMVIMKQRVTSKITAPYFSEPGTVIKVRGTR